MLFSVGISEIKCPINSLLHKVGVCGSPNSLSLCSSPSLEKALPAPAEALSDPSPSFSSG